MALTARFYFGPPPVAPPPSQPQLGEAAAAWATVKDSTDIRDIEAYRHQYGQLNPFYDRQAERRIDELKKQVAVTAPPPAAKPAPVVEPAVGLFSASRAPLPLKAAEERALKPKDSFKECGTCPEMVVVPAGTFTMGSPPGEEGRGGEEGPQRQVTIARPFAVGRYEVTFAEWDACVSAVGCAGNKSPSDHGWGRGKRPVIGVSWDDANEYVAWLSRTTGKTYRLLTEAEWEYTARADSKTPFWWGASISTGQANYHGGYTYGGGPKGEYRGKTVAVDSFAANPWGLYNVHGNVWEWVQDCWNDNHNGAPSDDTARTTGDCSRRVLRGGSWYVDPRNLRSAKRYGNSTVDRNDYIGFRVVRTL